MEFDTPLACHPGSSAPLREEGVACPSEEHWDASTHSSEGGDDCQPLPQRNAYLLVPSEECVPTGVSAPRRKGWQLAPPSEECVPVGFSAPLRQGQPAPLLEDCMLASGTSAHMCDLCTCTLASLNCACSSWHVHPPAPGDMQGCVATARSYHLFSPSVWNRHGC